MGDEYYLGYMGPEKKCMFFKISQIEPEVTCIVIFAVIKPESEINRRRNVTGLFIQLN